jgi:hypothetical protein
VEEAAAVRATILVEICSERRKASLKEVMEIFWLFPTSEIAAPKDYLGKKLSAFSLSGFSSYWP